MKRKSLMFDRKWMATHHGRWGPKGKYRFKTAKPTKHPTPLIVADKPWESMAVNWGSVVYDAGKYRLFYDAIDRNYTRDTDSCLCYAESDDCLNWIKPELGLVEYQGSKKNNIVLSPGMTWDAGYHAGTVFIDPTAQPSERYKLIFMGSTLGMNYREKPKEEWVGIDLIMAGYSADGLHWKMYANPYTSVTPGSMLSCHSETQRGTFWDPALRKYVAFFISREPGYNRCIARAETSDFYEWPVPRTVLRCDDQDPFTADMYNNGAMRYESGGDTGYFLFFSMFEHNSDKLNVQLATSRDSYTWFRGDRSVYLDNGPEPFDAGGIYVCPAMVPLKDRIAILYHGASFKHGEALPDKIQYQGVIAMATTPVDRFQGLHADETFEFSMAAFTLEDENLKIRINADIKGEIRVGLTCYNLTTSEIYGGVPEPVRGAEAKDCVPLMGDVMDGEVKWKGKPDLKNLVGRRVELRLVMERATLYCVEIQC